MGSIGYYTKVDMAKLCLYGLDCADKWVCASLVVSMFHNYLCNINVGIFFFLFVFLLFKMYVCFFFSGLLCAVCTAAQLQKNFF